MCAHIIITMFSLCVCVSTRPEAAGPLDLRFDSSNGVPASKLLSLLSRSQLERILIDGGEDDEIAARRIADAVALTNAMKRRRQGKAEMKKKDKKKKKKKKKEKKNKIKSSSSSKSHSKSSIDPPADSASKIKHEKLLPETIISDNHDPSCTDSKIEDINSEESTISSKLPEKINTYRGYGTNSDGNRPGLVGRRLPPIQLHPHNG